MAQQLAGRERSGGEGAVPEALRRCKRRSVGGATEEELGSRVGGPEWTSWKECLAESAIVGKTDD